MACLPDAEANDLFSMYRYIPTNGAADFETFIMGTDTHLAVAYSYNGSTFNINSVIYKAEAPVSLKGRVYNLVTWEPLPGVRIVITDGTTGRSDANGYFSLSGVTLRPQDIRCMKRGYLSTAIKKVMFMPNETMVINVSLLRGPPQ